ncbi:MAG: chromosome segregation protein SMC [Succiniclasticum sp.]
MYLKSVTALGFKSFADRTSLSFGAGITAIVGPNGSGKSNISDAVRWVLGEQRVKYLRGSKMEDVIFNGTSKRRPLGVAEVSLTFDNADRALALDFDEVTITRKLFRSGDSEYSINKKSCRLKDIQELLADTGMGKGAMFLIGQNRIDEILNSRPEERRGIFEEAASIAGYRIKKNDAARRLDETAANLLRINDIKNEVEGQVEPLRIEAERTQKYNVLASDLRQVHLTQAVNRIDNIEAVREKVRAERQEAQDELAGKTAELARADTECARLQQQLDGLNDAVTHMREGIAAKEKALGEVKAEAGVLEERIGQYGRQRQKLLQSNEKLGAEIQQWDDQLKTLAEEYDKLDAAGTEAKKLADGLAAEKQAETTARDEAKQAVEALRDSSFEGVQKMVELRNELNQLRKEQEQRMVRREKLKKELEESEARLQELQEEEREILRRKGTLEQNRDTFVRDGKKLAAEVQDRQHELDEVLRRYDDCSRRVAGAESRLRVLENMQQAYEGFGKGIKAVLRSDAPWRQEILGPAAALLDVDADYVTAVETALGAGAQNLVTRHADAAKEAIAFLKRTQAGRATFLPLDTVRPAEPRPDEQKLAHLPGIHGFAADLVRCDAEVEPAIRFLLGRVLVAENMDAALAAARQGRFRLRVVTLDGDVVNTGGSLTGGSRSHNEGGYLSRNRDIAAQQETLQHLHEELLAIQEDREEREDALGEQRKALENLRASVQKIDVELETVKGAQQRNGDALHQAQERLQVNLDTRSLLGREYLEARQSIADRQGPLKELEEANEAGKAALDEAQKKIGRHESRLLTLESQLQDAHIRMETAAARRRSTEERMKDIDTTLGRLQDNFARNEDEADRLQQGVEASKQRKAALAGETQRLLEELKQITSGQEDINSQRLSLNQDLGDAQARQKLASQAKEKADKRVQAAELERVKQETNFQNAVEQLAQEFQLSVEEARQQGLAEDKSEIALRRREVALQRQMEELGPVNPAAPEQYDAVKERYEFLSRQYDDLQESKEKLERILGEINDGMTKKFKAAFTQINEYFHRTYVQLFGGGTAVLKLTDPEDLLESGIDIEVQPPGKRLQSLYLLSGGERALTVIALLFALLSYHPTPFCILDEIDAPLDDANIERFAQFLQGYAVHTQFLVITHRKGTMEAANVLYGVTMEESGVSKILSVKMSDKLPGVE